MITHQTVQDWLDRYVQAWKSYDPKAIGALFSEDAAYYYGPYAEPVRGKAAIVESWLKNPDEKGTYNGSYHPIAVDGNVAVTNGRSRYFQADDQTLTREFDNIYVLHFDESGACTEFREWYMQAHNK